MVFFTAAILLCAVQNQPIIFKQLPDLLVTCYDSSVRSQTKNFFLCMIRSRLKIPISTTRAILPLILRK